MPSVVRQDREGITLTRCGRFARAYLELYRDRVEISLVNDDRRVSTLYWTYLTLRHLGRDAEAAAVLDTITPGMHIIENQSYHRLLLLYKGQLEPEELLEANGDGPIDNGTVGYGIGCWRWFSGDRAGGGQIWRRIVAGDNWPAFGYIAAEAELAGLGR